MPSLHCSKRPSKSARRPHQQHNDNAPNALVSLKATEGNLRKKHQASEVTQTSAVRGLSGMPRETYGWVEGEIDKIQAKQMETDRVYRQDLYAIYARCCDCASALQKSQKAWTRFCEHPLWESRKKGRPELGRSDQALFFVLMRAVFGVGRRQAQAASKVYRALNPCVTGAMKHHEIVRLITEARGIEQLAKQNASSTDNMKASSAKKRTAAARMPEPTVQGMPIIGSDVDVFSRCIVGSRFKVTVEVIDDAKGNRVLRHIETHRA